MTSEYFGVPNTQGKAVLGPSSPLRPALHIPDPLSITIAVFNLYDISLKKYYTLFLKISLFKDKYLNCVLIGKCPILVTQYEYLYIFYKKIEKKDFRIDKASKSLIKIDYIAKLKS